MSKTLYSVYINGDWHSDVEAYDEDDALDRVIGNVGYHVKETHVEPAVDYDWEPEEDYYPSRYYRG